MIMNRKPLTQTLAAALTVAFLTAIVPNQTTAAERNEHKELPAGSGGTLIFKTVVGAIEIKTHDKDEVTYDAELKPGRGQFGPGSASVEDAVFDYQTSGSDVTITMKWKNDKQPRNASLNVRHTLLIPIRYNLDVRTDGGSIVAVEIKGRIVAHTSGGDIRFDKVNGEIKAHTSGGGVTVENVKGKVDVGTSGGDILVGNVEGNVSASTSGGGIKLGAVTGEIGGSASGGSISAEIAGQIEQPLELSTSGGSIKLVVPGDFKADFKAETSGGSVDCELPIQGRLKRSSVNGKLNGGGPKVTLHTSGGSIKVAKR